MRRSLITIASLILVACGGSPTESSGSTSGTEDALRATPPIPYVLQFTGEYDGDGTGRVDWLVFHANGRFEASIDGRQASGAYASPSAPGTATFTFRVRGVTYVATASNQWGSGPIPSQSVVEVKGGAIDETLRGPWGAGGESMCDATNGAWTDDEADPTTGLFCLCPAPKAFVPSAGGCVALGKKNGDPARIPPGAQALKSVGDWAGDGRGRVTSLSLADDGTWTATIDGSDDWGTFWGGGSAGKTTSTAIVFTGVLYGFTGVVPSDGSKMTIEWGSASEDVTPAGG